jgi:hypothetical protein
MSIYGLKRKGKEGVMEKIFTIRCAWCKKVLVQGDEDAPISDGICLSCANELKKNMK